MNVSLLDLTRQYKQIRNDVVPLVNSIMESQRFVNGPLVEQFEKNFANFCGTKFAVGCSSGTDALLMSLMCLEIGPGDEVITTPFTFYATIGAIVTCGAIPKFVDVKKDYNINENLIEKAITKKTKAILPVHWAGRVCEMKKIITISKKYNIPIVSYQREPGGYYQYIFSIATSLKWEPY